MRRDAVVLASWIGLLAAIIGLVSVLIDKGIICFGCPQPSPQTTVTPIPSDTIVPTMQPTSTPVPTSMPTFTAFLTPSPAILIDTPTSRPPTPTPLTQQQVLDLLIPDKDQRALAAAKPQDNGTWWVVDTKGDKKSGGIDIRFRHPGYGRIDYWGQRPPLNNAVCESERGMDGDQPNWELWCEQEQDIPFDLDGVSWYPQLSKP